MRIVKVNNIKIKVFQKKELIEKLNFTEDEAKIIMKYQKTFPELLQDGVEGFVIDARILHSQLGVLKQFSEWIKINLENVDAEEGKDFNVFFKGYVDLYKQEIKNMNPQQRSRRGIRDEYYLTLNIAKEICMVTGLGHNSGDKLRENSKLVRNYFILMEKALRNYEYWTMVREPQKEGYIQLSKTLDENYKLTHEGNEAPNYIYSNEADMINRSLLGDSAKNINKLLEDENKVTREHFNIEINRTLNELQTMDMALVMAGLDYEARKKAISNICDTKYISISLKIKDLKEAL